LEAGTFIPLKVLGVLSFVLFLTQVIILNMHAINYYLRNSFPDKGVYSEMQMLWRLSGDAWK
jgi:hypothetical protein